MTPTNSSQASEELAEKLEQAIVNKDIVHRTLWGRDLLQAVWAHLGLVCADDADEEQP